MSVPLFILYGSATGNSEHIAKDLAEKYSKKENKPDFVSKIHCHELNSFKSKCQKMWEVEPENNLKYPIIVVCSTTGNGDSPENCGRFIRYIKRKNTVDAMPFRHCVYAVLGLGDTNYDQFCQSGKVIDSKMKLLGGTRAKTIGMADEGTGLEQVVEPWTHSVMEDLRIAVLGSAMAPPQDLSNDKKEEMKEDVSTPASVAPESAPKSTSTATSPPPSTTSPPPSSKSATSDTTSSPGMAALHAIASTQNITTPFAPVSMNQLPKMGASLSSCELLDPTAMEKLSLEGSNNAHLPEEHMTISSHTSSCQYNVTAPYESTILAAKYVTNTPIEPVQNAAKILLADSTKISEAAQCLDAGFDVRNGGIAATKRVVHMELSLPDDFSLQYTPGDSIAILVHNDATAIDVVLEMLLKKHNIQPDQPVLLNQTDQSTIREVISRDIDICSVVKKRALYALAQHCADPMEADALQLLSSKTDAGEKLYQSFIEDQVMNVADVLLAFPSCAPPLEALVGILPAIAPRYYSVSSSPLVHPSSVTVAFSVVDYVTKEGCTAEFRQTFPQFSKRRKRGVATRYLETILAPFLDHTNDANYTAPTVRIFPKPTQEFRLPVDPKIPLIFIGPGTGVAPFIGFLAHRSAQIKKDAELVTEASQGTWRGGYVLEEGDIPVTSKVDSDVSMAADYRRKQGTGSVDLFFGCRHRDHDWLFRGEMEGHVNDGILTHLHTAFSREQQRSDRGKLYVQDRLKEEGERIAKLILQESASVFICGDGNAMAKDVQQAFLDLFVQFGDNIKSVEEAEAFLSSMKTSRKFLLDIWS